MGGFWLWALLTLIAVLVAVSIVLPLAGTGREPPGAASESSPILAALARELAGIDREQAEGLLAPAEAEALRAAVRRRLEEEAAILAAALDAPAGSPARRPPWLAHAVAAAIVVAAAGLYGWLDRPDSARGSAGRSVPAAARPAPPQAAPGEVGQLVQQLEARLRADPSDAAGWRMLGWSRFELGDYAGAAEAYGRAAALEPGNALYLSALGEAQVMASDGRVTPAARESFRRALAADPSDARARYYLAAARDQDGDTRGAVEDWLRLVGEDPSAPFVPELRSIILDRARSAGMDVAGRLPPAGPAPPPGMLAAPSREEVARASALSPQDRQAMIRGMVDGLEARLAENPRDLEGWLRLIRARMVLGETARARAAYAAARRAFASSPAELQALERSARELGLPLA